MVSVSVLVPSFNEESSISQTVSDLEAGMNAAAVDDYEIIVIDDGSTDDTQTIAGESGAKVVAHVHNLGYGSAIKSGLRAAGGDTIVIIDADGTYPAKSIGDLLEKFREGYDMVVGARRGIHYRGSHLKWPLRIALRWLVEWVTGREIPDINSGFRVFARENALNIQNQLSEGFSFTTTITLIYMMTGKFVGYLPIDYDQRIGQSKVVLWRDSIKTFSYILMTILYYAPMKIFTVMSGLCVAIAGVSLAIGIVFELTTGFLMAVGSLIASLIVFALGLLAELLRQVILNLKE